MGNIVNFGHVNLRVTDQVIATTFFVTGLGLTRDPYLMTGTDNMWVNVGGSQFHLPTAKVAQRLRGTTALVVPDLGALAARLEGVRGALAGTHFGVEVQAGVVHTTSPEGNHIDCYAPDPERFGPVALGLAFVDLPVAAGTADGIARFYRDVLGALAEVDGAPGARVARVTTGHKQYLIFRESAAEVAPYDGHHLQIYLAQFSQPYERLTTLGLIASEDGPDQYRFRDIVDPLDGRVLYTIEHEVRSLTHPMFGRDLINRDPQVDIRSYAPGHERLRWATPGTRALS